MRLGQLSRKVNVKPTEILSYLKNEFDVELGTHLNTKVEDELAKKVIHKFASPVKVEVSKTQQETVEVENTSDAVEQTTEEVTEPIAEEAPETEDTTPTPVEFEPNEEVDASVIQNAELIKAPKVELDGPKVVGKIELPPSLEEQMVEIDGVMISKAELANRKREERKAKREKAQNRKTRSSSSARKSRVKSEAQLEQMKRDKEAEEMAKRLENREKRIAAKKKAEKKTNSTYVPKPVKKKITKKAEQQQQAIENQKPEPTTWYGKLWKWFNT